MMKDAHPRFIRFPGGCVAEGFHYRSNIFRKKTIVPVMRHREDVIPGAVRDASAPDFTNAFSCARTYAHSTCLPSARRLSRGAFTPADNVFIGIRPEATDKYEAPTAFRLEDGRWCHLLDYYAVPGKGQGYVPFLAASPALVRFRRADDTFSFPYCFKHGNVLPIILQKYERLSCQTEWPEVPG